MKIMKNWCLIVCCILFVIGGIGCDSSPTLKCENFEYWYRTNIQSTEKFDTSDIIKKVSITLARDSQCLDILLLRARLLLLTDKSDEAKNDYLRVTAVDSKNVLALYNLGMIYKDDDKFDSSIHFFNKALELKMNGNVVIEFNTMSKELGMEKDKYNVHGSEIIYQLGVSYYYAKDWINSRKCFDYCIEGLYLTGNSYLYLGAIAIEGNRPKEACDYFSKAKFNGNKEAVNYLLRYCQ